MFKQISISIVLVIASTGISFSQTTASQTVTGYYANSGTNCTVGPCFVPYGPTTPINTIQGSTSTDISGTVTTGGTYQIVAASNTVRKNCVIQNPSTATEPLDVKIGTMSQPFMIAPGESISALSGSVVATDTITVSATTTGHVFAGTCQ